MDFVSILKSLVAVAAKILHEELPKVSVFLSLRHTFKVELSEALSHAKSLLAVHACIIAQEGAACKGFLKKTRRLPSPSFVVHDMINHVIQITIFIKNEHPQV